MEFFETLRAGMSAIELAIVALSACLAGFMRGFLGFGGALVIILGISVVLSPLSALPIACLSGMPSTLQLLPVALRLSERAFVLPYGLSSFLAAPIGTWILVSVQPALMKIFISSLVLILVVMLHRGWRFAPNAGAPTLALAGTLTGLLQSSAGVGGPAAVAIALSRTGTPEQQRANVIGAVTALSLCSLIPMWYAGLFTAAVIVQSLAIVPLYSAATWIGTRYFSAHGKQHYRSAALLALAAIGVVALAISIRSYVMG
jgi:uncharacterized membrane protein YfcA